MVLPIGSVCIDTDFVNLKLMGKFEKRKMTLEKKNVFGASFYCNPKCGQFYPPPPNYAPGTSRVKLHVKIFPMFVCIQLSRQLPAVARFAQSGPGSPIVRRQVFCRNPGGRTCQVDRCVYLTSGRTWQMGGPACQVGRPDRICPV